MLDTEPTGADGDQTRDAVAQNPPAETPTRTRRRRAATSATTSPTPATGTDTATPAAQTGVTATTDPAAQTEPAASASRGEPGRSASPSESAATASRRESAGTAPRESAAESGQAGPVETEAPAAPTKAPRKRTPRKSAATAESPAGAPTKSPAEAPTKSPAEPPVEATAESPAALSTESPAVAPPPAKRTRSRRSASASAGAPPAADTAATSTDAAGDATAAVDASGAEAGDAAAAPAKRTRSRRVAKAPAGSPPHVDPTAPSGATTPTGAPGAPTARADEDVPAAEHEPPPARRRRSRATKAADQPAASDVADVADVAAEQHEAARPPEAGEAPEADESTEPSAAAPFTEAPAESTRRTRRRATAPQTSPPPAAVMFVAPTETEAPAPRRRSRAAAPSAQPAQPAQAAQPAEAGEDAEATRTTEATEATPAGTQPRRRRRTRAADEQATPEPEDTQPEETQPEEAEEAEDIAEDAEGAGDRRRRRRGRRGRGRGRTGGETEEITDESAEQGTDESEAEEAEETAEDGERPSSRRRRRRRRRGGSGGDTDEPADDDPPDTVVHVRDSGRQAKPSSDDEVRAVRGSTRLEAKRQRRREGRDTGRRRAPILSEAEFLARREAVDRVMVVRQRGDRTQIAVLEDDILVEHYVTKASSTSYAGNVYLGRVQNVLPSMEAAFVDIGKGRNAVLYAGEVNWDVAGLEGRARSIEHALKSGDNIVVQVTKDPIGHKGARLTSQVSLPGRYLVYVPNGSMTGISRKLPDTERARLKDILRRIVPDNAGVIIRTAAEGASEEELTRDVERLKAQWESIQRKATQTKSAPTLLYAEPDLELRVVRDVFNEDFTKLVVSGDDAWEMISQYVDHVAPDLLSRLQKWTGEGDAFHDLRIDEQLLKGLDRKVWLPSGGSLIIDRTEAMTVIDVNTGKFVGQGGNLEQTVTRNNLEAAEEIVRQLRLRDIGGIIVIDFIDMVLESNRDLVLRRLTECLGRDRTKHQVAEVTSLGLVQMTRKRVGQGLLEAFSEPCPTCGGRGLLVHTEPVDDSRKKVSEPVSRPGRRGRRGAAAEAGPPTPALIAARGPQPTPDEVDVASEDHRAADEAVDTVEAVEPEAEVTVRPESEPLGPVTEGVGELPSVIPDVTEGLGEFPGAVPDPNAGLPNAPEPVADPDAPAPTATRHRDVPTATGTTADAAPTGTAGEPASKRAAAASTGTGRRRGRRRAEAAAGSPPPTDAPAGPLETVGALTGDASAPATRPESPADVDASASATRPESPAAGDGSAPATRPEPPADGDASASATRPESPADGTAPDGSEPVAGSNGVVAAGTDTVELPSTPEPVAGSNGAVGTDGDGSAPRRRRRTASRPAGPPQPVSGE